MILYILWAFERGPALRRFSECRISREGSPLPTVGAFERDGYSSQTMANNERARIDFDRSSVNFGVNLIEVGINIK